MNLATCRFTEDPRRDRAEPPFKLCRMLCVMKGVGVANANSLYLQKIENENTTPRLPKLCVVSLQQHSASMYVPNFNACL